MFLRNCVLGARLQENGSETLESMTPSKQRRPSAISLQQPTPFPKYKQAYDMRHMWKVYGGYGLTNNLTGLLIMLDLLSRYLTLYSAVLFYLVSNRLFMLSHPDA